MKNRCKAIVLTLVLSAMIASGCANNTIESAKLETTAENTAAAEPAKETTAATEPAKETTEAKTADNDASTANKNGNDKEAAKAYLEQLKDTFHEYANSSFPFADELEAYKFDDAEKSLDDMKAALDKMKNISAPSEYADKQAKLASSLSSEYYYIDLCRKFISYCKKGDDLTQDDKAEVHAINKEIENISSEFSDIYLDLVKTVKADIDK